jgi:hypothetical protein
MTTKECLIAARKRIEDPKHWTRGSYFDTVAYCAIGCIRASFLDDPYEQIHREDFIVYADALRKLSIAANTEEIVHWNDAPERRHEEVLAAFDRAIQLAELAGQIEA